MASASSDGTIRLWNVSSGEESLVLSTPNQFNFLSFSRDGKCLVSGGEDGILRLWDLTTGEEQITIEGHPVNGLALTPNGRGIVTGSPDETVKIWDLHTREPVREYRLGIGYVLDVAVSSDGRWGAAGGSEGIALFDLPRSRKWETSNRPL